MSDKDPPIQQSTWAWSGDDTCALCFFLREAEEPSLPPHLSIQQGGEKAMGGDVQGSPDSEERRESPGFKEQDLGWPLRGHVGD